MHSRVAHSLQRDILGKLNSPQRSTRVNSSCLAWIRPRYRYFVDYYRRHVCRVLHACAVRTGTKIASRLIVFWQASVPRRSPSLHDVTILGGTCSSYFPAEYNTDSSNGAREFHCTNVPPRWQPTSESGAPRVIFRTFSLRERFCNGPQCARNAKNST